MEQNQHEEEEIKKEGEKIEIKIELNVNELIRRANDGAFHNKSKRTIVKDRYNLYGTQEYCPNKEYYIIYSDGFGEGDKWENGTVALIRGVELLFKKRIQRPNDCHVSNDGFVICCDWLNTDKLAGKVFIFNKIGEDIFSQRITANLGTASISADSRIALFETHNSDTKDSNQLFVIDIDQKKVIKNFDRPPHPFISAEINTDLQRIKLNDNKGITFEIDYEGNQTNSQDYEEQVLSKGSIHDQLWLFENKDNVQKLKDERYLSILDKALKDKDACYSFGKDKIYKKIGECYESLEEWPKAIENWEKAIEINPRIGLKKRIELLRKQKS